MINNHLKGPVETAPEYSVSKISYLVKREEYLTETRNPKYRPAPANQKLKTTTKNFGFIRLMVRCTEHIGAMRLGREKNRLGRWPN